MPSHRMGICQSKGELWMCAALPLVTMRNHFVLHLSAPVELLKQQICCFKLMRMCTLMQTHVVLTTGAQRLTPGCMAVVWEKYILGLSAAAG